MAPAETPDVIITLVSCFCGLPARRSPKGPYTLALSGLFRSQSHNLPKQGDATLNTPPGKKTKNTLACVFTVANVLGTCHWYHRSLVIYRWIRCCHNRTSSIQGNNRPPCCNVKNACVMLKDLLTWSIDYCLSKKTGI